MRAFGFKAYSLGQDRDGARAKAEEWNCQWDVVKRGHAASEAIIVDAGWSVDQAEDVRAYATLRQVQARVQHFVRSSAASYLSKGLRGLARELKRAAKSAATNAVNRDVPVVGS